MKKTREDWTEEKCIKVIKKYEYLGDLIKNNKDCYLYIKRFKFEHLLSSLIRKQRKRQKYTKQELIDYDYSEFYQIIDIKINNPDIYFHLMKYKLNSYVKEKIDKARFYKDDIKLYNFLKSKYGEDYVNDFYRIENNKEDNEFIIKKYNIKNTENNLIVAIHFPNGRKYLCYKSFTKFYREILSNFTPSPYTNTSPTILKIHGWKVFKIDNFVDINLCEYKIY